MDNFLGEIRVFPYNRIPTGWAACNGALLPIQQNNALFALLGIAFGGNGTTNFALPDLRGRAIVNIGQTSVPYTQGGKGGTETVTLLTNQIPQHTHQMGVQSADATVNITATTSPGTLYLARPSVPGITGENINLYNTQQGTPAPLNPGAIASAGGNAPHENRMPYLPLQVCIATTGIFPSRQ